MPEKEKPPARLVDIYYFARWGAPTLAKGRRRTQKLKQRLLIFGFFTAGQFHCRAQTRNRLFVLQKEKRHKTQRTVNRNVNDVIAKRIEKSTAGGKSACDDAVFEVNDACQNVHH